MIDLKIMLLTSFACLQFSEWSGVVQWFSWKVTPSPEKGSYRLRPFDCAMCLTLWVSLAIFVYLDYKLWSLLYSFANSGLTVLISKVYERITKK